MPRPEFVSEDEYESLMKMAREVILEMPQPLVAIYRSSPVIQTKMDEVSAAGLWLGYKLREAGANHDGASNACKSFGQACVAVADPWVLANQVVEIYHVDGTLPCQPGPELAARINAAIFCGKCNNPMTQMWVGGNTTPRRLIDACPVCDVSRVGQISE